MGTVHVLPRRLSVIHWAPLIPVEYRICSIRELEVRNALAQPVHVERLIKLIRHNPIIHIELEQILRVQVENSLIIEMPKHPQLEWVVFHGVPI